MKRRSIASAHVPTLSWEEVLRAQFGDPARFLRAMLQMSARPDRGEIGFDHEALEWISRVWGDAALAATGDSRLRDACIHERDRYKRLETDLKNGEYERGDSGIVFLTDAGDWPHPKVMRGAIDALTYAEIKEAN